MADTTPKEVEIEISRPFITNGKQMGVEIIDGKQVFTGRIKVPMEVAEDIKRREHEYDQYERDLLRNNGETLKVKEISVGGA